MNKMAIFVEGYTELLFVEKLIKELAAANQVVVHSKQVTGPASRPVMTTVTAGVEQGTETHFVLIMDCGGDHQVKTRMVREYDSLTGRGGYGWIVCLRDLYPCLLTELPEVTRRLRYYVKRKPVVVDFILAIMEVEAWFLAEHTHFLNVNPTLNCQLIHTHLGFDPSTDDMTARAWPANDLRDCYSLVGATYQKGNAGIISMLDFTHLYMTVAEKVPQLQGLISVLDGFLSSPCASNTPPAEQ